MEIRVWEREVARPIQAHVDEEKRGGGGGKGKWRLVYVMYIYQADILVSLVFFCCLSLLPVFFTPFFHFASLFFFLL